MKKFNILCHTADIGLKAYGCELTKLFENAAQGMCSYLLVPVDAKLSFHKKLNIEGVDRESLLAGWLNEILRLSYKKRIIVTSFTVKRVTDNNVEAEIWGRNILEGNDIAREIKAVTYHNLKIKNTKKGYSAKLYFDV